MADKHDQWADTLSAGHSGWLTGFLAEEDKIDRRMMWRLGSWGVVAVGAVVVAILASQSQVQLRREQVAASDMIARQAQQIQFVARETQTEAKRLSSAIETLNSDRDRLFARVTSMEQGLEAVTGSIKRQSQAPVAPIASAAPTATPPAGVPAPAVAPQAAAELPTVPSAPLIGPVASTAPQPEPATPKTNVVAPTLNPAPLAAAKSIVAPPDAAATKLSEPPAPTPMAAPAIVAAEPPAPPAEAAPSTPTTPETTASVQTATAEPAAPGVVATPVARTEFGVDVGGANSVDGLRAVWRGISRSHVLKGLRPIITVKERSTGLGMQLRLVAGPLNDAAAAAKICAALIESKRPCETTVFDGQRLALKAETPPPQVESAPLPKLAPAPRKRATPKPQERTEQAPPPKPVEEAAPPKPQSSLTSFLGLNRE